MKIIGIILLALGIAFSLGGRFHIANISQHPSSWVTFQEKDNLWKNWKPGAKKKPVVRPGTSAWGTRDKNYTKPSMSGGTKPQVKPAPGSLMDTYQKSMSKESLDKWKQEATASLQSGRNPIMEAFKSNSQEKDDSNS